MNIYNIKEYKLVCLKETSVSKEVCDTPDKFVSFFHETTKNNPYYDPECKETFFAFFLNTRKFVTGFQLISMGTLNTILVHPRDVFRAAIVANSAAIIIAHNHPSGDPTPSEADVKVTRDLIRAGQLLKIDVLDHIVIGKKTEQNKGYTSLRELGYFYS